MKRNWAIIISAIIIGIGIIIFTMYLIDMERMKHNYDVVFSTWGRDYESGITNPYADNEYENDVNTISNNDVEDLLDEGAEIPYTFDTELEKVNEYNGKYSLLVDGLDTNEINHKAEFWCSISDTTKIVDENNNELKITDLKEGLMVSITYTGGVQETYPAKIGNVLKVQVLD